MNQIADATADRDSYKEVMGVIARRLQEKDENWRHVYKSLLLLEHLIKHGTTRVVDELRQNLSAIERLKQFQYKCVPRSAPCDWQDTARRANAHVAPRPRTTAGTPRARTRA